jgi:hypothetical protein
MSGATIPCSREDAIEDTRSVVATGLCEKSGLGQWIGVAGLPHKRQTFAPG